MSAGMALQDTFTPQQAAVQCCHLLLTSPEVAGACYFLWDVVKHLFRCTAMAYLLCSLSSSHNASNSSAMQGLHMRLYTHVHMMATHTTFDYELVTWGSDCI